MSVINFTALTAAVQEGDRSSWRRIGSRYAPIFYALFRHDGQSPAASRINVRKLFAEAYRQLQEKDVPTDCQSTWEWLQRVKRQVFGETVQMTFVPRDGQVSDPAGATFVGAARPVESETQFVDDQVDRLLLWQLWREQELDLDPLHADVFRKVVIDGEDFEPVAERAGRSVSWVASICARVTKRLKVLQGQA